MSKEWQDFLTFAFLAAAYVYTIILCVNLLRNKEASEATKIRAGLVLFIWVLVIPIFFTYMGAWSDLWQFFKAPFAR